MHIFTIHATEIRRRNFNKIVVAENVFKCLNSEFSIGIQANQQIMDIC